MKTTLTLLLLTLCVGFLNAQELKHSDKIIEVYGQDFLDQQLTANPAFITLIDKYVDHGFKVKVVSPGKHNDDQIHAPISEIPLRSKNGESISVDQFVLESQSEDFNPLRYGFFPEKVDQIYKLQGYDLIIYVYNQDTILLK